LKVINDGKQLTLHLSFMQAAIITEALRKQNTKESLKIMDTMLNHQQIKVVKK